MPQARKTPQSRDPVERPAEKLEPDFKPMKLGEPFQHPLPKIDGDPFAQLLESRRKKDSARCDAWKDEVYNLLIFAGLFSAIVTAFIIESYKGLKQDSSDVANILLLRILAQLEAGANGTTSATPQSLEPPDFSSASSDTCINILWFLSLILSLTTVLVGIIALQWLREHMRSRSELETQIELSLHHMGVECLDPWYLPQIFTTLPALLLLALVLFLAGIIVFLWNLDHAVAIPIIVAIGFSLLFLLGTTVLPTFQALSLFLPRWLPQDKPRFPCPYRSPQSWAFHQLVRPLINIVLKYIRPQDQSQRNDWRLNSHSLIPMDDRTIYPGETDTSRRRRPTNLIFRHKLGDTWAELGIAWLFQRDLDAMQQDKSFKESDLDKYHRPVPIYDTVKALGAASYGSSKDILHAHHCVEPITLSNKLDRDYIKFLYHLLNRDADLDLEYFNKVPLHTLNDHSKLCYHQILGRRYSAGVKEHVTELALQYARAMFADGPKPLVNMWAGTDSPLIFCEINNLPDGQEQLLDILESYFRNAAAYHPQPDDAGKTAYFSRLAVEFLYDSNKPLLGLKSTSPLFSQRDNLFRVLAAGLRNLDEYLTAHPPPDYLFFAAFIHVYAIPGRFFEIMEMEGGRDLILSILQYRARFPQPRQDVQKGFYETLFMSFDNNWLSFVNHAKNLGVELPRPAEKPSADPQTIEGAEIQEERRGDAIVDVPVGAFDEQAVGDNSSAHNSSETDDDWSTT